MVKYLKQPKVVAISDVGFDHNASCSEWREQEQLFRRILDLGTTDYVLVMYLRGSPEDLLGVAVHDLSHTLLQQKCSKHQRIHLHNFAGDAEQVKAWTDVFPNCYFRITGMVTSFIDAQVQSSGSQGDANGPAPY